MVLAQRQIIALLVAVLVAACSRPAHAWIELAVRSDNITIDVTKDGNAVVAHELMIYLRGGPLREIALDGVDLDAEPLPDATITRAQSGRLAGLPIPLTLAASEGQLRGTVQLQGGLRGGTYLVRARYRTDFHKHERIVGDGVWALVRWPGPRHATGVDSMRVLFRLPRAENEPRVPGGAPGESAVVQEGEGVFLSTVRRGDMMDEIEIVRPHVARAEEVVWRTLVDPRAFEPGLVQVPPARIEGVAPPEVHVVQARSTDPRPWAAGLLVALVYGLLVTLKGRVVASACRASRASPRSLVPAPLGVRALLAGGLLAAAIVLGWATTLPTVAALALAASMAFATSLPPVVRPPLRGPGAWERAAPAVAFAHDRKHPPVPGRAFDAGQPIGFSIFIAALVVFVALSAVVFRVSAYHGVEVLLSASCLFPLFCTGRAGELPPDPIATARLRLEPVHRQLAKRGIRVVPLMRIPASGGAADEVRLLVDLEAPIKGLQAIEIGVDHHRTAGGALSLPFVIVRVQDGSPAVEALPVGLLWTRGRHPDERVSVLRPRLPLPRLTLALILDVVRTLSAGAPPGPQNRQPASKAKRSGGSGASTAKPGVRSSPAHAT